MKEIAINICDNHILSATLGLNIQDIYNNNNNNINNIGYPNILFILIFQLFNSIYGNDQRIKITQFLGLMNFIPKKKATLTIILST